MVKVQTTAIALIDDGRIRVPITEDDFLSSESRLHNRLDVLGAIGEEGVRVVDDDGRYRGAISKNTLLKFLDKGSA